MVLEKSLVFIWFNNGVEDNPEKLIDKGQSLSFPVTKLILLFLECNVPLKTILSPREIKSSSKSSEIPSENSRLLNF
jgi:hypothetical protein